MTACQHGLPMMVRKMVIASFECCKYWTRMRAAEKTLTGRPTDRPTDWLKRLNNDASFDLNWKWPLLSNGFGWWLVELCSQIAHLSFACGWPARAWIACDPESARSSEPRERFKVCVVIYSGYAWYEVTCRLWLWWLSMARSRPSLLAHLFPQLNRYCSDGHWTANHLRAGVVAIECLRTGTHAWKTRPRTDQRNLIRLSQITRTNNSYWRFLLTLWK